MAVLAEQAILFDNVTKGFAGRTAVRGLTLRVPRGSIYGLLGPNGAGKTTSIRMLMAILLPDAGRIRVLGLDPNAGVRDRIGYLPEERGLYPGMKVVDNLVFFGGIHGLATSEARRRAGEWLERLSMADAADRKLQELSKGNQQKIQFIAAVLHGPELLVLDEPFTGLDPVNQDRIRETILSLTREGTTVILSTHLMDEVERLCSHITLIDSGRALVAGELDEVKRLHGADTICLDVGGDTEILELRPDVAEIRRIGRTLEIRLVPGRKPSEFLATVAGIVPVRRFEVRTPSLHSIFVRLVRGEVGSPGRPGKAAAGSASAEGRASG